MVKGKAKGRYKISHLQQYLPVVRKQTINFMRLIILFTFCLYSLLATGQLEKLPLEYPKEYKKVERFNLLLSSDTFDSFERVLILTNDSIFRTIHFYQNFIFKDSGHYVLLNQNTLLFQSTKGLDTVDILAFQGQRILVSRVNKHAFISHYLETKSIYEKSKKKDRKRTFKYLLLSQLYFDHYSYHGRNEYTKWLIKNSNTKEDK